MNRGDEAIPEREILNPKHQIPNSKQYQMTRLKYQINDKAQNPNKKNAVAGFIGVKVLSFGIWNLANKIATPRLAC
jgi:hypothetical protein